MSGSDPPGRGPGDPAARAAWGVVLLVLVLHLLPRPGYGYHRDELLYLAMGDHLDFFRMQFPPMIAVLARIADLLPGARLAGIHLLSALALAAIMAVTIAMVRRLGGGGWAQLLAALGMAAAPLFQRTGTLFQPVIYELLWWTVAGYALLVLLDGGAPHWWLLLGLAMGLGGLTKFSAAVFGVALGVAVLLSPLRRQLKTRWPWLGVLTGALVALPSVTGQLVHGWPFFTQLEVLRAGQLEHVTPAAFLGEQVLLAGAGIVLVLAGLLALPGSPPFRRFRGVGLYAVVACLVLMAMRGKSYYLAPVLPLLFAVGAAAVGSWLATRPVGRWALVLFLVLGGLTLLPMGIPLLPPPRMAEYAARLGITRATATNVGTQLPLPQDYADMTGWREQVAGVWVVYLALPAAEQARTVIVGANYGRAGALAAYHREFNLPYPASRSGDFHAWGPRLDDPAVVIVLGGTEADLREVFGEVREAARVYNAWGVEEERDVPIHVCRHPRLPFRELWRQLGPEWG